MCFGWWSWCCRFVGLHQIIGRIRSRFRGCDIEMQGMPLSAVEQAGILTSKFKTSPSPDGHTNNFVPPRFLSKAVHQVLYRSVHCCAIQVQYEWYVCLHHCVCVDARTENNATVCVSDAVNCGDADQSSAPLNAHTVQRICSSGYRLLLVPQLLVLIKSLRKTIHGDASVELEVMSQYQQSCIFRNLFIRRLVTLGGEVSHLWM